VIRASFFVLVYQYKIPVKKTIDYINLEKQAIDVYQEAGCLDGEKYRDAEDTRR